MNQRLKELMEKRQKSIAANRDILDRADKEKRGLTAEEQKNWDDAFADQEKLKNDIEREKRQIELDREMAGRNAPDDRTETRGGRPDKKELEMRGLRGVLLNGANYQGEGAAEIRALQADSDTAGGFIRVPEQFIAQLIKDIDDEVLIRQWATVLPMTNADGVGIPSLDADPADSDWTTELATGSEDSTMSFGKRELKPKPLAKRIKVSRKLLRASAIPADQLVRERLAYKFGITQEKAFLTGTGAGQPLGLFTASANGISTSRDKATGNTSTAITFDGLIENKYNIKPGYQKKARWLFHRDGVKMIAKLKDGEGQYIWQPSKKDGDPDRLLGDALFQSEYAPNTFTTGLYVGLYGDFSYYWINDALLMDIQVLNELYAETGQVGYIGRLETDAMPVLGNAFSRVKLA